MSLKVWTSIIYHTNYHHTYTITILLALQPCLVFILFYTANVQTDPRHRILFQFRVEIYFTNLQTTKHLFLLGKNTFISVSHSGSLHGSVPAMAIMYRN